MIDSYKNAIRMRHKTPDDIEREMHEPQMANFALHDYHFPNGIQCGVGKSRRPGHGSMFQLIVTEFDGKPNVKFPQEYAGEYTSQGRAEKALQLYCKEAWENAEDGKTKQIRKTEAAKQAAKQAAKEKAESAPEVEVDAATGT